MENWLNLRPSNDQNININNRNSDFARSVEAIISTPPNLRNNWKGDKILNFNNDNKYSGTSTTSQVSRMALSNRSVKTVTTISSEDYVETVEYHNMEDYLSNFSSASNANPNVYGGYSRTVPSSPVQPATTSFTTSLGSPCTSSSLSSLLPPHNPFSPPTESLLHDYSFSQRALMLPAQVMASLLLSACLDVYVQKKPTEMVPDATTPTHKDNVTVVVNKLIWVPVENEN
jgi:hypothetical protein